ncbi:MAG TPA: radical SAM protein [Candidatus Angelobacter sp.]|nr:radical SAM protein [Candidatus Angelobacter sp.]
MTTNFDFQSHPFVAIWETNARSGPQTGDTLDFSNRDGLELTDKEAEQLIRDIAELRPPVFFFAGDDPLRRENIYSLVQYAASCGLHPNMIVGPNSNLTRAAISDLKKADLSRLGLTLDAGTAQMHDHLCAFPGSFARTLEAMKWANECRLPLQIHTNLRRRNLQQLKQIASVIRCFRIVAWIVSFPAPQPRESLHDVPSAAEFEEAFALIHELAQELPFKVKTEEAPHYRPFVVQQRIRVRGAAGSLAVLPFEDGGIPGILPINEAMASIFISSTGEIFPAKALRISGGNIRRDKLAEIYRNGEPFASLRDPDNVKGKCGECEFKDLCGGSRARAWALHGDMFEEEPCCSYLPIAAAARKVG